MDVWQNWVLRLQQRHERFAGPSTPPRHTHPEDNPAAFQRLRAAYESAMAAAAEVKGYGRDHLQAVLEPDTVAWWERWGSAPAEPWGLWGAQTLHRLGLVIAYFVLGITALAGVAVWRIWMKGKSLDPSLLKFIGINLGVMLACYVTICLVAVALLLMPAKGRPRDN